MATFVNIPEGREVEYLNDFFRQSALTLECVLLEQEGLDALETICRSEGFTREYFVAYKVTGAMMNRVYNLTGDNAYPNDASLIVIPGVHSQRIHANLPRARWFSDIVAINALLQNNINYGTVDNDFIEFALTQSEVSKVTS